MSDFEDDGWSGTVVVFELQGMKLGVKTEVVKRVLPRVALRLGTEVVPVLEGFLELRDEWVPVVRLDRLLRLNAGEREVGLSLSLKGQLMVVRDGERTLAWGCDGEVSLRKCGAGELKVLPKDHALNHAAGWVLDGVVILEPELLLLEEERVRLKELGARMEERRSEVMSVGEEGAKDGREGA
ncbi:hypothetical protein FEM03_21030 [Phragmitibacter flavus]|uniref:CheW-like domain-containing protein n=2 Tax=Phragmitibacter flavus TaxID=2576071 RepID=A0A5R8KB99_9BACT|nr:hypothetical protein FEM03_21030 [Phragmitibacter flavus]